MKRTCYVIVCTDGSTCWTRILASSLEGVALGDWAEEHLDHLLQKGWQPVRETPMSGDGSYAYSLVLLEKE